MPKITVHGGPSSEYDEPEGGEDVSAGSSSETSSESERPSPKRSGAGRRKPAPRTESRSAKDQTDDSSAPGTDGAPTGPSSEGDAS